MSPLSGWSVVQPPPFAWPVPSPHGAFAVVTAVEASQFLYSLYLATSFYECLTTVISPPGRASILHCQGHIHQTVPNLCSSLRSPQIHSLPDPLLVDSIGIGGRRSILHPRSVRSPFSSNIHQWSRVPDSALGCAPTQPCSGCEQEGFCPRCVGIIRFIRLASVNAASYGVSHASLPIPPSLPVTANMSPDSSTLVHPFPYLYPASPSLLSPPEGQGQSRPLTHKGLLRGGARLPRHCSYGDLTSDPQPSGELFGPLSSVQAAAVVLLSPSSPSVLPGVCPCK